MIEKLMMMALTLTRRKEERGATATEYGLLVALVAIVIVVGVTVFGEALSDFFDAMAGIVTGWTTSL